MKKTWIFVYIGDVKSAADGYYPISDNLCSEGFAEGDGRIFEFASSHLANYSFVLVFF